MNRGCHGFRSVNGLLVRWDPDLALIACPNGPTSQGIEPASLASPGALDGVPSRG